MKRFKTKDRLMDATVRLVAEGGNAAATIQAIAREAGVTEGAIYRHYRSKEELRWAAYERSVLEMIQEKQELVARPLPIRQKLHEWVRLTFACFDRDPASFTYVLLTPTHHLQGDDIEQITTAQGRLFKQMYAQAADAGLVREMPTEMALSHLTGLMLNVPRLINQGAMDGPALGYVNEIAGSLGKVFEIKDTDGAELGEWLEGGLDL